MNSRKKQSPCRFEQGFFIKINRSMSQPRELTAVQMSGFIGISQISVTFSSKFDYKSQIISDNLQLSLTFRYNPAIMY